MLMIIAAWGLGAVLNVIHMNMEHQKAMDQIEPLFKQSMEYGEDYCPAPSPTKTNAEFGKKVMALADCKRDGLCLSADGNSCIKPIVWGDKNAPNPGTIRHVNSR